MEAADSSESSGKLSKRYCHIPDDFSLNTDVRTSNSVTETEREREKERERERESDFLRKTSIIEHKH